MMNVHPIPNMSYTPSTLLGRTTSSSTCPAPALTSMTPSAVVTSSITPSCSTRCARRQITAQSTHGIACPSSPPMIPESLPPNHRNRHHFCVDLWSSKITQNFVIANYHAVWPLDHDDGSCYYYDYDNVLVYGGFKSYLGHSKICGFFSSGVRHSGEQPVHLPRHEVCG